MADLSVSLVIRAIDRATAPMRRVTKNFEEMRMAATRANRAFATAANMRQAAEGVNSFARIARRAMAAPVSSFADFEAAMSGVRAVSKNMSDKVFAELTEKAEELGSKTRFTATQAAQGFRFFAIAGWDAQESMKALPAAMDLSVASGTDLARTADIMSDLMGAFSIQADDARVAADKMAVALTSANLGLEDMFEALKLSGPVAKQYGFQMSEIAAMTGLMANSGIKGSLAGTALRSAMLKISDPSSKARAILKQFSITVDDAEGNLRPLPDILAEVSAASGKMGTRMRTTFLKELVGLRAVSGMSILLDEGADSIRKFTAEIENSSGAVKEMADIADDNLRGAMILLESAFDGLLRTIGKQVAPVLRVVVEHLTIAIQKTIDWTRAHPRLTRVIGVAGAAVAALATALTVVMFTMAAFVTAMGVSQYGIGAFRTGLTMLRGTLEIVALRMEAAAAATKVLSFETMPAKKGIFGFAKDIIRLAIPATTAWAVSMWHAAVAVAAATWPILLIVAAIAAVSAAIYIGIKHWDKITGIWERFKNASLATKIVLVALLGPIVALLSPFLAIAYVANKIKENWEPIKTWFVELWETVTNAVREAVEWLDKIEIPAPIKELLDLHLEAGRMIGGAVGAAAGAVAEVGQEAAYVLTGAGEQRVSGEITMRVESDRPTTVTGIESEGGIGLGVETGPLMSPAGG